MTGLRLTPQQAAAAERGPGDACVMAGAGSGKTTVLTARFATLAVRDRIPPRSIAALTFTDKAAGEMRDRIAGALSSSPDPDARRLAAEVEFAPVSTIHAFGARLLREHAIAAGVDPAFVLLDETEADLLREEAWAEVDRRLRRANHPALAVLRRIGDEGAWRTVLDLHDRLRGLGVDPGQARLRRGPVALPDAVADLTRALEALAAAVASRGLKGREASAYADALARLPAPADLAVATHEAARRATAAGSSQVNELVPLPNRCATQERSALKAAYAAVGGAILDDLAAREVEAPVATLLREVDRAYLERKREKGALDFADLERRTLSLLESLAARGEGLEGAPLALLVDEFQDTNPLQARILACLRAPGPGRRVDLFAVGDTKQSIYRFRRADVAVMGREWDAVGPAGRTRLTESFRSRPEVVRFHNELFSRLLSVDAAGVAPEPMEARAEFHEHAEIPPEVLLVDASTEDVDPLAAEAAAVARRVREWVEGGGLRTRKEKGPDGRPVPRPRPLHYGDVAVLLRSHARVRVFERAFQAAGIPFHVGKGRGFYDTPEIADLVHLLRVVHDPRDRFAVAAWMASPAVGATDDDLLAAFGSGAEPFEAAADLPAVRDAAARVRGLRRLAAGGSLEDTVRAAVEGFDAVPTALLQSGGTRRARNLEKAVSIARRLDEQGSHGLFDFLRRLTDLRAREVDEPEASAGGEDHSVALLTVHAAKGLEWPCVVVAGTNMKEPQASGPYLLDEDGAVGWRLRDPLEGADRPTGGYGALKALEDGASAQESLRLLYVALTRAEERLLVSAGFGERKKDGEPSRLGGWSEAIWDELGVSSAPGEREARLGAAGVRVAVEVARREDASPVAVAPWFRVHGPEGLLRGTLPGSETASVAAAGDLWARARRPVPTLGRTPYVVTISDLLAFGHSPADYYRDRVVGAVEESRAGRVAVEREDPGDGREDGPDEGSARAARAERWDEGRESIDGIDRAALGRAVHRALERHVPGGDVAAVVTQALGEEFSSGVSEAVFDAARAMVARFLGSEVGRAFERALAAGADVRREVAFHARIRFPQGATVAGFDSLLVKGTIDLWMPDAGGGVRILDFKTNSPRSRLPDARALARHYETQLRLYALAAERVLRTSVSGAALLLLDPAWEARGVGLEVPVDVSGEALERTRGLCRDFARALFEGRFPAAPPPP